MSVKDVVVTRSTELAMKKTRSVTEIIRDRVFTLCHEKNYEGAIQEAEFLMQGQTLKQKTFGLRMMAYILVHQKRETEAANLLLEALEKYPADRGIYHALVRSLIDCARYQEAIRIAERLIRLDINKRWRPFTDSTHFHKAYALFKLGQLDEAESELKRVKEEGRVWIEGHLSSKPALLELIAQERRKK